MANFPIPNVYEPRARNIYEEDDDEALLVPESSYPGPPPASSLQGGLNSSVYGNPGDRFSFGHYRSGGSRNAFQHTSPLYGVENHSLPQYPGAATSPTQAQPVDQAAATTDPDDAPPSYATVFSS